MCRAFDKKRTLIGELILKKTLLANISRIATIVATNSHLRFFTNGVPTIPRVVPTAIFAENHSDPTPKLKAMTYNQFVDEKGQQATLESTLQENEESQILYQQLQQSFIYCGFNDKNKYDKNVIIPSSSHHNKECILDF